MHIFLDNFHQGEKYSAQRDIHQAELRKEETFTDQKSLSILSLKTNYLKLESSLGFGKILREQILSRQSALFVEVPTILQKNVSKGSESKSKNLVQLVIWTTDKQNARLVKALHADLKIIQLRNVQSHQKRMRNGKIKYILVKEVLVHCRKNATTARITMTKIYMHLWHICLITMNFLVIILVTVCN